MAEWVPRPAPPMLGPQWSAWIVIVAILFLVAVFAFYVYVK
jgi:hypothetical protein